MIREKIKRIISQAIKQIQKEKKWANLKTSEFKVEHPDDKDFGDYSTNAAMILAGLLQKNPMEIADLLIKRIKDINKILKIKAAKPGFINFTLSLNYLQGQVKKILKQGDKFGRLKIGQGKKIQVEFISANPTGPLTIGNARGGPMGDVLANILEKAGFKVEKAYYVNNYGGQILTLGHSVLKNDQAKYQGEYIDDLNKKIFASPKSKKEKDPYRTGQKAAEIITSELIKKTTDRLGIKFDEWFYEQTLYDSGRVDKILGLLSKKDLIYKKDKALWFKSSKFGDEKDRVIVKSNGFKTYLAGDIAYHQYKFKEKKFDKVINIWGADHYGDMPRLKGALEALGHKGKLEIIFLQFVSLIEKGRGIKMSKRAGVYVTMDELLNMVGVDAVRFFFLQKSAETHLNFDLSLAKEQSERNPVYYVQYAHARICSLLRKIPNKESSILRSKTSAEDGQIPNKFIIFNHPSELDLIRQLIKFPEIIEDIANDYQVQRLPNYSLELAASFHKFYKDCRVLSDDQSLAEARLTLVKAARIVFKNTLSLMGLKAPDKM